MSSPQPPPPPRDSKSSLYNAAVEAIKSVDQGSAARLESARAPRARQMGWRFVLLLIGLAGSTLLLWRPPWLTGPTAPPRDPPGIAAASLRLALLRERQRVTDYLRLHGHPPASLAEAGGTLKDLEYLVTGPSEFSISGRAGDSLVTLRSTDSMTGFLGRSLNQIRSRGQP